LESSLAKIFLSKFVMTVGSVVPWATPVFFLQAAAMLWGLPLVFLGAAFV
jgi:hypothetical protein